ncbi:MAG: hypothetical protein HC802_01005 [Caldilineaceae bacterium]|nr:hypothetical protein [Caldilineaceae bacterium]
MFADQPFGRALQSQDRQHRAGQSRLHRTVVVGLVAAKTVVAEHSLDVGVVEEMERPLSLWLSRPCGQHLFKGRGAPEQLGQPMQRAAQEERVGHMPFVNLCVS